MQVFYDARLVETGGGGRAAFALTVADGRVFLQSLDAKTPLFLNAEALLPGARRELLETDRVYLAGRQVMVTQKYWLKPGLPVACENLVVRPQSAGRPRSPAPRGPATAPDHPLSISLPPGTLTAIMGPAGCGKTLLLDVLTGTAVPAAGAVRVGGQPLVPGRNRAQARQIGYVTQQCPLTAELTVYQSLDYRLRLRFPDMSGEIRGRRIAALARQLAIEPLLHRRIGSTDRSESGRLSGGQAKQVALAHELLMRPEILCLDEPTSGLSAGDAWLVAGQLRALADTGITVIVTIHQPPPKVFAQFQNLVLMAHGGRILYSGPPTEAVAMVARATGTPLAVADGENPADYLVTQSEFRPDEIARQFLKDSTGGRRAAETNAGRSRPPTLPAREKGRWRNGLIVFTTLVARNLRVFAQDATNLRLAVWQIPAIALMVLLAFYKFETDAPESQRLSRVLAVVTETTARYRHLQEPVPLEETVQQALSAPDSSPQRMTELAGRLAGAVLFTLVAAAFWIGLLGACREIVMDKALLRHECRTHAPVRTFLTAKLTSLSLVALPQCALLALATAPFLLPASAAGLAGLAGTLWLTALAAAGLGLLTATLAPTPRAALTAVPLIMVPQLLFAGLLRPEAALAPGNWLPGWLSGFSLQRWGFELALATAGGQVQSVSLDPGESLRIVDALDHLKPAGHSLHDVFFKQGSWWRAALVLAGVAVAAVLVSERHLRRKFHL